MKGAFMFFDVKWNYAGERLEMGKNCEENIRLIDELFKKDV